MSKKSNNLRLAVKLVGAADHPDFRDAMALLRVTARTETNSNASPEVIVVGQSRPGQVSQHEIESFQRRWPLAGIVAVLGSWCGGEIRTGRPWPGVKRFYWYEFPMWWQQQIALREAGLCPEWARATVETYRDPSIHNPGYPLGATIRNPKGAILLSTANRNTADVLAESLHRAGYATVWNPRPHAKSVVRGAVAGVWDGGQLDDDEVPDLAAFCRSLARDATPVVALLDFPRRDRCEVAKQLGVAAVLGKPWINADLVTTIGEVATRSADAPKSGQRAA
jgi:hypothetical protein